MAKKADEKHIVRKGGGRLFEFVHNSPSDTNPCHMALTIPKATPTQLELREPAENPCLLKPVPPLTDASTEHTESADS